MRGLFATFCCVMVLIGPVVVHAFIDERDAIPKLSNSMRGRSEKILWDRTRVDIITPSHAWEVDKPERWAEAIGQSLYYASVTGKKPGVIMLVEDIDRERRYIYRLQIVAAQHGIDVLVKTDDDIEKLPLPPPI